MFGSKKKLVSDKDFVTLHDCWNDVRRAAKYDEFGAFKKNALKIDDVLNGVDRRNYAMVVRKLILYDHKWEVCFTGLLQRDLVEVAIEGTLRGDNSSPVTLGRSLMKTIRESDGSDGSLYGRFLDVMWFVANSTLPATLGDRTVIIDGNRTSAAGNGFPHCFMDIEAFASDGQYAIPVWESGLEAKVYGLAVCEL